MQTSVSKVTHAFLAACAFGLALATSLAVAAADRHPLIGSWKLVSWQVIAEDGTPHDVFGASPKGYLVLTPEGRSIVVTTAAGRQGGMDDANRAALHKSMLAYSGRYRVEGSDFITTVEVSWNEEWNGTEQRRHYSCRFGPDPVERGNVGSFDWCAAMPAAVLYFGSFRRANRCLVKLQMPSGGEIASGRQSLSAT